MYYVLIIVAPSCDALHQHTSSPWKLLNAELPTKQVWLALVNACKQHKLHARKKQQGIKGMQSIIHRFITDKKNYILPHIC